MDRETNRSPHKKPLIFLIDTRAEVFIIKQNMLKDLTQIKQNKPTTTIGIEKVPLHQ